MNAPDTARSERSLHLQALLSRAALGDRAAFEALYRDTSGYLLGVILRIVGDRDLAEDLLQEVYVNVWRAAGGFDAQRSQPLTWLTSIARNRAIDGLRRRKADPVVPVSQLGRLGGPHDSDGDSGPDLLESTVDDGAGPLELMQQAAEAQGVQTCLEQLTHEQQQCLSLAYYRGLSHAETAAHLSQPLGTVKSWVRRALLAMRDCLGRVGLAQGT
jgi:RNA polymerase sigma-70 factor (ECF subfamily)